MSEPIRISDLEGEACKLIVCVITDTDERSDLVLLKRLRAEKNVIRAISSPCLSSSILAETKAKPGKLPEPVLARHLQILVLEEEADDVFDFVCENSGINQFGGGGALLMPAPFGTMYRLPEGVPDEPGED